MYRQTLRQREKFPVTRQYQLFLSVVTWIPCDQLRSSCCNSYNAGNLILE